MRDYDWVSPAMRQTHGKSYLSLHPYLQAAYLWLEARTPPDAFLYLFVGQRTETTQNLAYRSGNSNARFGQSYHNMNPSLAFDVVPVWQDNPRTIEWDSPRTTELLSHLAAEAQPLLAWGGAWKSIRGDVYHFQIPGDPKLNPEKLGIDPTATYSLNVEIKL